MKKFLLFTIGIIALLVLLANLGPIVLLGVSIWLLYLVFKQFIKANSIFAKVGWVVLGLIIVSIAFSNIYAVIGIAAAFILYIVVKKWKEDEPKENDDPFIHFEDQWNEFKYY